MSIAASQRVETESLLSLQQTGSVEAVRNFCILAHVDHGKTTLSDSLVSSNGFISERLAGRLRFLDSTEEEQKRGITMHSSAIALYYALEAEGPATKKEEFLMNLVDSPGHIDFSSDVSTAARLCDGALIVVDVLEGVCTQTHAVIFKALRERMKPCLVLNKVDRLILEAKLSPVEAFGHLRRIVENVNALAHSLVHSEFLRMEAAANASGASASVDNNVNSVFNDEHPLVQMWMFAPERGNVQFASAFDGWGFGVMRFLNIYHRRYGVNRAVLRKYLFDDFAFLLSTKKIVSMAGGGVDDNGDELQPMFASLVLTPIWEIYKLLLVDNNIQAAVEYAKNEMEIQLTNRDKAARDPRVLLQTIMRQWLPLSDSILRMVARNMPNPREAQANRVETLLMTDHRLALASGDGKTVGKMQITHKLAELQDSVARCQSNKDDPLVVFVSKMMPVRAAELTKADLAMVNRQRQARDLPPVDLLQDNNAEVFVALCRVFSGVLHRHSKIFVLSSKYDPSRFESLEALEEEAFSGRNPNVRLVKPMDPNVDDDLIGCYIPLGPSIYPTTEIPAGNIAAIVGLEDYILKTATLSDSPACEPLKAITFQSKPMLKVAVEPSSHQYLSNVDQGLQQLYQFDPVVEIGVGPRGEHTMTCLGELHLDQCVKALRERFAKCEIEVSEPLVTLRETIVPVEQSNIQGNNGEVEELPSPWKELPHIKDGKNGRARLVLDNVAITFHAIPIPMEATNVMDVHVSAISHLESSLSDAMSSASNSSEYMSAFVNNWLSSNPEGTSFWSQFHENFPSDNSTAWCQDLGLSEGEDLRTGLASNLVALGPRNEPTNVLCFHSSAQLAFYNGRVPPRDCTVPTESPEIEEPVELLLTVNRSSHGHVFRKLWSRLHNAIYAGFQEATSAGPLMHESLFGVGFVIERLEISRPLYETVLNESDREHLGLDISSSSPSSNILASLNSGALISAVQETLRIVVLSCPVRVVEPIYRCDLQCDQSQLGNLYAVLDRRGGEVIAEDIIEGTTLFLLTAYLPVARSFNFTAELLKKTSGNGTAPQMSFAQWRCMESDPFWKPRTEDELEEFGAEFLEQHNAAREWINKFRKRKGLPTAEQVVVSADKQRTLSRKK